MHYPHACKECVYLGPFTENEGTDQAIPYDLYFCRQGGLRIPTVIARYGESPPDYKSGLDSSDPVLQEAQRRAEARNLTPGKSA